MLKTAVVALALCASELLGGLKGQAVGLWLDG